MWRTLKQKFISITVTITALLFITSYQTQANDELTQRTIASPNEQIQLSVTFSVSDSGETALTYSINKGEKNAVLPSQLALELDNHLSEWALAIKDTPQAPWMKNLALVDITQDSHRGQWTPVYGERNTISDNYNQLTFSFIQQNNPNYPMTVEARVYDEGVAFRYHFPDNPTGIYYRIIEDETQFTLPSGTEAWHTPWAQGIAKKRPLNGWEVDSERPLTLELSNGLYVSLAEAGVVDFVRTKFTLDGNKADTIAMNLHHPVDIITGTSTPWRVVMVADSAAELLQNNDILLNLNAPHSLENTDWIKPGKIVRDMTLTEEGALEWIDFAAEHNLQYILFDWKWYGPSFTFDSDASTVSIDLDLPKVIAYGKSKGVGVWLYVNQQALLAQDEDIFPLYKEWGIAGVKYGFVQVGSRRWTTWLHDSIQRAADNELMVNIHDEFRLTGEQRTWPNIVTVEGIRGNEEMPDANNNTTLPFTRGLAGMGDYTICYYDDRIKTTHAHQLALSVVMYSPLQTLFWYDSARDYEQEPEIEFFSDVPTVWDDTKILAGEIGEFITTARRRNDDWFVGTITNNDKRDVTIPLDFLSPDQTYTATIYTDDKSVNTRTEVAIEHRNVTKNDVLSFSLQPSGGAAIKLTPM